MRRTSPPAGALRCATLGVLSALSASCAEVWGFEEGIELPVTAQGGIGGAAGAAGAGGSTETGGWSPGGGGPWLCDPPCDEPPNEECYEPSGSCNVLTNSCSYSPLDDGSPCAETSCGPWGDCTWAGQCSSTGTQSRDCVDYACTGGQCETTTRQEGQECTRTISNGTSCSSGYCCSGSCVPRNSDAHCGSCGIDCGVESCVEISTHPGYFSCTCYGTQQCRDLGFGSDATCWDGDGQMICNCQCGAVQTCTGQCAGGGTCTMATSHNYCHY